MSKLIPAAKRVEQAREFIAKAQNLAVPEDMGWANFSYIAQVRDILRQARDLVKLIPYSPSASDELKAEVKAIFKETEAVEKSLLHR